MNKSLRLLAVAFSTVLIAASAVLASGSDTKEESKTDKADKQKATEQYNQGVKHMEKARQIAIVGDSAFAYNYRATSDAKATREYEKAVVVFSSAVKLDSKFKEAYNNLGFCYRKLGKLDESLAAYQKALKIDTAFEQAREYLGETYLALGELEKAEKEFDFLTKLKSAYADTLAQAIKLYKLQEFSKDMEASKKGN